jgi:hypothetical protein
MLHDPDPDDIHVRYSPRQFNRNARILHAKLSLLHKVTTNHSPNKNKKMNSKELINLRFTRNDKVFMRDYLETKHPAELLKGQRYGYSKEPSEAPNNKPENFFIRRRINTAILEIFNPNNPSNTRRED